jgi:hypothetical protein
MTKGLQIHKICLPKLQELIKSKLKESATLSFTLINSFSGSMLALVIMELQELLC